MSRENVSSEVWGQRLLAETNEYFSQHWDGVVSWWLNGMCQMEQVCIEMQPDWRCKTPLSELGPRCPPRTILLHLYNLFICSEGKLTRWVNLYANKLQMHICECTQSENQLRRPETNPVAWRPAFRWDKVWLYMFFPSMVLFIYLFIIH